MAGTTSVPSSLSPLPPPGSRNFVARGITAFGALVRNGELSPENGVMRLPVWNEAVVRIRMRQDQRKDQETFYERRDFSLLSLFMITAFFLFPRSLSEFFILFYLFSQSHLPRTFSPVFFPFPSLHLRTPAGPLFLLSILLRPGAPPPWL